MDRPVTIQADEVLIRLFSPDPILNIKEAQNVQYQSTMCSTQKDKRKRRSNQEVQYHCGRQTQWTQYPLQNFNFPQKDNTVLKSKGHCKVIRCT